MTQTSICGINEGLWLFLVQPYLQATQVLWEGMWTPCLVIVKILFMKHDMKQVIDLITISLSLEYNSGERKDQDSGDLSIPN